MTKQAGNGRVTLAEVKADLERFPSHVLQNFESARDVLADRVSGDTLGLWAGHGLELASKSVRSWEAASEYFLASPAVQRQLPSGQFLRWAACGDRICSDSPSVAVAFFRASPETLVRLRPRYINDWAGSVRALHRGTWKSSALASKFAESTPELLETLSFGEFVQFGSFLEKLSRRSYDLATKALVSSLLLFPRLGTEISPFISLAITLTDVAWREVTALLDSVSQRLIAMDSKQRSSALSMAEKLALTGHSAVGKFLDYTVVALGSMSAEHHARLFDLAISQHAIYPAAVIEFIRSAPAVLARVSFEQFEEWHRIGLETLSGNHEAGMAYFRAQSTRSIEVLDSLSSGVELGQVREIVRMYCNALCGQPLEVQASQQLVDKNIGWVEGDSATTEGTIVYLPAVVNHFSSKVSNFGWYKVVATHQVGHIEFGSFNFKYERGSSLFGDLRPKLEKTYTKLVRSTEQPIQGSEEMDAERGVERAYLTDMGRFFALFQDNRLALDIFTVVEDVRLDSRVVYEYRGIAPAYYETQQMSLLERPDMTDLPARQVLVEFIVRLSLRQDKNLRVPKDHAEDARTIARIVRRVAAPIATVEDSAEATIRIYALIYKIQNEELGPDDFEDLELEEESKSDPLEESREEFEEFEQMLSSGLRQHTDETDEMEDQSEEQTQEEPYESPEEVGYRGEFKPELSQLLSQIAPGDTGAGEGETHPVTPEQLEELLKQSAELELEPGEAVEDQQSQDILESLMKELARRDPDNQKVTEGTLSHLDEDGGPLEPGEVGQFVYDEWDFRANEYKPRWCLLHEKNMSDGEPTFFSETLVRHASVVRDIRRQFELVVPEQHRKVKRLEDGEEADLDAVIEALVDLRSGNTPSDKLWWRRNKIERSIAVAFLLDMSASTAEAIDDARQPSDDWGAPEDPVEYMVWLRSRRSEGLRRSYKRIIDVEKEGIVLLVDALESMGDTYGIFGFSGYGRENVEFYVIKDLDEKFSSQVPRRIDRITPLHATRMGPAIRHTTSKLVKQEARSRFLFLISDGRPQDRGYSREGVEKEYAVQDTKKALVEARREGITPFCLTVDRAGHDYLKTMMQDMSYEVLSDITVLPKRLPHLYRRLTT